jgi:hypothetical protein
MACHVKHLLKTRIPENECEELVFKLRRSQVIRDGDAEVEHETQSAREKITPAQRQLADGQACGQDEMKSTPRRHYRVSSEV